MVVRDGHISAIIDWAYSGWYPEYWEFTKAHYNWEGRGWEDYLALYLPNHETELTAERKLWRMLPLPGSSGHAHFPDGTRFRLVGSSSLVHMAGGQRRISGRWRFLGEDTVLRLMFPADAPYRESQGSQVLLMRQVPMLAPASAASRLRPCRLEL